jgi:serine/threonine protein kinase
VHVAAYITHEVARALRHLHDKVDGQGQPLARVHGSVNGHNVLLLRSGRVKLIARSPLPARGDRHADLFALGLVAWEMLVGWPPEAATSARAPMPPSALRPDLPNAVDVMVLRALERDPRRRYAGAAALAGDTARFLATRPDPRRGLRLLLGQVLDGPAPPDPSCVTRQTRVPWRDGSGALPALPPPPPLSRTASVTRPPSVNGAPVPPVSGPPLPPSAGPPPRPTVPPPPAPLAAFSQRSRGPLQRWPWLGKVGVLLFQTIIAGLLAFAALLALGLVRREDRPPPAPTPRGAVIVPMDQATAPRPPVIIKVEHHPAPRR